MQAQCGALTQVTKCMCSNCEMMTETDPQFVMMHEEMCSPVCVCGWVGVCVCVCVCVCDHV